MLRSDHASKVAAAAERQLPLSHRADQDDLEQRIYELAAAAERPEPARPAVPAPAAPAEEDDAIIVIDPTTVRTFGDV